MRLSVARILLAYSLLLVVVALAGFALSMGRYHGALLGFPAGVILFFMSRRVVRGTVWVLPASATMIAIFTVSFLFRAILLWTKFDSEQPQTLALALQTVLAFSSLVTFFSLWKYRSLFLS